VAYALLIGNKIIDLG